MVLGALAAGALLAIVTGRWLRQRDDALLRRTVAVGLAINELFSWVLAAPSGVARMPLQLCDLATFLSVWALWHPRRWHGELAYFWAMAGSLQAILTPDVTVGFPDYWCIKFFIGHVGVVLSVVYLAASGRLAPTHRSVWHAWAWTNVYAAVVGLVNWWAGTNYGYLARKPLQPSLLDAWGPWPWYILAMDVAALASFYLYYTPFVIGRRWARHVT